MNNGKTVFYLVRHGESEGNLRSICLGHTDLDLTDLGHEQARKTAQALSDIKFDAIYSSDLIRAQNTARPHCAIRNMTPILSREFRELYFGDWENCSVDYLKTEYHDDFVIGWRGIFGTFTPPNGESVTNMAERMRLGLEKIASERPRETILVVSHAAAIRALWGEISGLAPERWAENKFPSNASYSIVEYDGEKLVPKSYSCDEHLGDLSTNIKH